MKISSIALLMMVGFLLVISANSAHAAGKVLYDDFSSGYLDGKKWWPREYVREIVDGKLVSKLGNSSGMGAEFVPGIFRNNMVFQNSGSIYTIECDMTVVETKLDSNINSKSFAEVSGYFYNTSASGGSTGDLHAMLVIGDQGNGLEAFWEITRRRMSISNT